MSEQTTDPPLSDPRLTQELTGLVIEEASRFHRIRSWAAGLPWWAITLVVLGVVVIYTMATSEDYQEVLKEWLTDNPQWSTYDLYDIVSVRAKPNTVTGVYEKQTTDSPQDVVYQLLDDIVKTDKVVKPGFVEPPVEPVITVQQPAATISIPREQLLFPSDPGEIATAEQFSYLVPVEGASGPLFMQATQPQIVTVAGKVVNQSVYDITIETSITRTNIQKNNISEIQPADAGTSDEVVVDYTEEVNVTGVLVAQDDSTMTVRTRNEEIVTFDPARILSTEPTVLYCDRAANPNCADRQAVIISRQGEQFEGTLISMTRTVPRRLSIRLADGSRREVTLSDVESYSLDTLTIAVNQQIKDQSITSGAALRIGYLEGTDLSQVLAGSAGAVEVPLRYSEGNAAVELVAYPDATALVEATAAGEVDVLIYIASGEDRLFVQQWIEANADAGLALAGDPRECDKDCPISVKMRDDTVTGVILEQTGSQIKVQTQEPQFVVLDKDEIIEERSKNPGVCALNNLRGCDEGIFLTLYVTFLAYALALVFGLITALMRISSNPIFYNISTLYVEIVRGLPLMVILIYAAFVVVPRLRDATPIDLGLVTIPKFDIDPRWSAIIGLSFGYGAFIAEIFRAGIQSIGRGQMEAARSLGMSYAQAMRCVILPQAIRVVLPPLGNDFIALLKDSALISVLALPDLMQKGRLFVSRTYDAFLGYSAVAVMYLFMTLLLSMMVRLLERRTRLPS